MGGDRIGTVGQLVLDDETGRPEFVTVDTGLLGRHETLPTAAASTRRGDDALRGAPPRRDDVAGGRPGPARQVRHDRHVTQTVPVRKEKAVLEREPITDANVDAATSGPDLSEEEHEVVLSEERAVVNKTVEPVERVRVGKVTATEEQTVSEDVRKERIEAEGDVERR